MKDRFKFRIPMFTDKGSFMEFQYIELGDGIECTLCGYSGEPQQCTGLKDKNGKLIYESDIVKETLTDFINEEIITVVKWDKLNAMYNLVNLQNCEREVIGNIYENKSLLESEGEDE